MRLTNTIYLEHIEFKLENGQYSARAVANIKSGTLVLLEHVYSAEIGAPSQTALYTDEELFNELYPRNKKYGEFSLAFKGNKHTRTFAALDKECCAKRDSNSFIFGKNMVLGKDISKFNHSCHPNSFVDEFYVLMFEDRIPTVVCGVYAMKNIKAGDELTVNYVSGALVDNHGELKNLGINCACTDQNIAISKKKLPIEFEIFRAWMKRDSNLFTDNLIDEYMDSDIFFDTAGDQHLVRHGFGEYHENPIKFSPLKEGDDFQEIYDSLLDGLS